jgi:hypothetical protein
MCICCFVIIVPFSVLVIYLILKGRKQAWKGTIIDKNANVSNDMDSDKSTMIYSVRIKSDEGREFNYGVDKTKYNEYKIGDRLVKESGKIWAEKETPKPKTIVIDEKKEKK